ncbi:MAG: DUF1289 domain-containing protein [Ramlibacter sp.]|nr:DUF1289 domain-containing protein [Ramlibacter sp.]
MTSAIESIAEKADLVRAGGQNVPSPCLSVCRMSPTSELCAGCFRTLEEIAAWSRLADADKRVVWSRIEQRIRRRPHLGLEGPP